MSSLAPAPASLAAPHIPHSFTSQEWSDAKSTIDSPSSSAANIVETAPPTTSSREASPSRILSTRNPSIFQSPNRSHKKSSSVPSPATRKGHVRKLSGIPKSPSVPTFQHPQAASDAITIILASPLQRTKSNNPITRSPSRKKAPAYHSSYGVETELGPPPSYSTQRTLSQDRVWRGDLRSETAADEDNRRQQQISDSRLIHNEPASNPRPGNLPAGLSPAELISSPDTLDDQSIDTPTEERVAPMAPSMASYGINIREDDQDVTLRGLGVGHVEDRSGSSSDERKSEDLFLNIARKEAAAPKDTVKEERRRSRISLPFLANNRPSSSRGRDHAEIFDPSLLTPKTEVPHTFNKRSSFGWQNTAASAHPLDSSAPNSARSRYFSASSRNTPSIAPSSVSRDNRPRSPEMSDVQRRYSGLNGQLGGVAASRTQRYVSDSNALYVPKAAPPTESTISTTAPSTVWDELDDLKSRIKKLELTGKLPTSSAAAMSSMERPRTATTTVTTMSSSPKHNKNIVQMQSAIEGVPSTVHPLLHEALNKAQGTISNDAYQKLQASAHDALQLFAIMGGGGQNSAATDMGIPPSTERQIRRRADDMCRNLTELAIALSAEPRSTISPIPVARDIHSSGIGSGRRMSNELVDRAALMSRAQSRIESRRTSLRLGENRFGFSSPAEAHTQTPPSVVSQAQPASRVQRTATVLRNRRAQGYDGSQDEDDASLVRPVSRARTDIGRSRLLRDPADFSREYTSQHPMPLPQSYEPRSQMPQSIGSTHLLRRKYGSPGSVMGDSDVGSSPITPALRDGIGRISVMGRQSSVPLSSPLQDGTPENVTIQRGSGGARKSMGLASRIGSTVGSRLRAVRAERMNSGARRESDLHQLQATKEQVSGENRNAEQPQEQTLETASMT
jgi:hypothetical protein